MTTNRERAEKLARKLVYSVRGWQQRSPEFMVGMVNKWADIIERAGEGEAYPWQGYSQGRLDQFLRMKEQRPADPTYWDKHEEASLRSAVQGEVGKDADFKVVYDGPSCAMLAEVGTHRIFRVEEFVDGKWQTPDDDDAIHRRFARCTAVEAGKDGHEKSA